MDRRLPSSIGDGSGECVETKKQLVAVLLSWLVGEFGVDRMYVGQIAVAIVKLLLPVIALLAAGLGACCGACLDSACIAGGCAGTAIYGGLAATSLWWLIDAIMFTTNSIP